MDFLLERFATAPDNVAFARADIGFTYREVLAQTAAYGERLDAEGVRSGEVVVVLGDYSPALFCLLLALARIT